MSHRPHKFQIFHIGLQFLTPSVHAKLSGYRKLIETIAYMHIVLGIMVLIVGFVFHWIGQLISIVNWEYAEKVGLQEKKALPEYKVYEHAIATSDGLLAWTYGIVAIGLIMNLTWSYTFVLIPGTVLIYHSLFYWQLIGNQNKFGHPTHTWAMRITWFLLNFITGILAILIAI